MQQKMEQQQRQQQDSIYNVLPTSLGGPKSRPTTADIHALLPHERSATTARNSGPSSEQVNDSIRHKLISLEPRPTRKPKQTDPTKRDSLCVTDKNNKTNSVRRNPKRKRGGNKIILSKEEQKYDIYQPLLDLWLDYATRLKREDKANFHTRITRMDLHGAPISIIRALDPGLIGIHGILIAETANTIVVVTKKNKTLTVPKNITVINIHFDGISLELFLPALAFRASERSARKIKKKHMPYI